MDILLSFQYKTLVDKANFHGSLRPTLNFPGIKLLGSYILSNRSKHRTFEEHSFQQFFDGTFCFPFETSFISLHYISLLVDHNCQWKQEGKSKSFPEYINGHDQGQHYQCQKYFAPTKQKSGILISKLTRSACLLTSK